MKEDEAKTKWCPHKRLTYFVENQGTVGPCNCVGFSAEDETTIKYVENTQKSNLFKCIASDCMMWVWENCGEWVTPDGSEIPSDARTPEEVGAIWKRVEGRCGLIK